MKTNDDIQQISWSYLRSHITLKVACVQPPNPLKEIEGYLQTALWAFTFNNEFFLMSTNPNMLCAGVDVAPECMLGNINCKCKEKLRRPFPSAWTVVMMNMRNGRECLSRLYNSCCETLETGGHQACYQPARIHYLIVLLLSIIYSNRLQ